MGTVIGFITDFLASGERSPHLFGGGKYRDCFQGNYPNVFSNMKQTLTSERAPVPPPPRLAFHTGGTVLPQTVCQTYTVWNTVTSGMGQGADFSSLDIAERLVWPTHWWVFFGSTDLAMCGHGACQQSGWRRGKSWTQVGWAGLQFFKALCCFALPFGKSRPTGNCRAHTKEEKEQKQTGSCHLCWFFT